MKLINFPKDYVRGTCSNIKNYYRWLCFRYIFSEWLYICRDISLYNDNIYQIVTAAFALTDSEQSLQ